MMNENQAAWRNNNTLWVGIPAQQVLVPQWPLDKKKSEGLEDETSQITTKDTPYTATELSKLKREYS